MLRNDRGVSWIEILIVLGIFAGVMFLAVPNFLASIRETKQETDKTAAMMMVDAAGRVLYMNKEFQGLNIEGLDLSRLGTQSDDLESDPLVHDFAQKLWIQLSDNIPKPVYKHYPVTVENFILTVKAGREICVYAGVGIEVAKESSVRIYPELDLDYGR